MAVIGFGAFLAVFFVFYVVLICCCCCPRVQCSSDVDQMNESCCRKLFRCLFCCCLCFCSRKTTKSDRGKQSLIKGFRKRKETKYSLLEDLDESTPGKSGFKNWDFLSRFLLAIYFFCNCEFLRVREKKQAGAHLWSP